MKIDSSTIGMESTRSYRASNASTKRFMIAQYQQTFTQNSALLGTMVSDEQQQADSEPKETSDKVTSLKEWQNRLGVSAGRVSVRSISSSTMENIRQASLRYIFELLFSSRRSRLNDFYGNQGFMGMQSLQSNGFIAGSGMNTLNFTQESWQYEQEETNFSTVGTVRTSDGREIRFNVQVGMSREFQQYYKQDLQIAKTQMCDPLVINLDTDVAELTDQKFYFDIDADGVKDEISTLGRGSGYLALDKNGDGVINDGSELFGTKSGDGFADLAKYDEDGNGWIDENDAIWSKLKIWCKDENGKDVLYRLADKGVGAICLQNVSTDFMMKDTSGAAKGAIRSTGIFLYENGAAGTMQHVDLAKSTYQKEA
ncbi:MAG: hypothetical protein NC081_03525 [Roseburia sp.]|nr:hypothetical protein [Roseburia sp.]